MKKMWALGALAVVALALVVVAGVNAADEKEVTLKGTLTCGKCTLKETAACSNVLQVKEGEKTINYYITDEGKDAKYHVCPPNKKSEATVTGVVTEKDGKKMVKASKVEVK